MKRKSLIYIGNKLSQHGFTPTSVETLGPRLAAKFDLISASSIRSKPLRLLEIWWVIWTNRRADYLLIDTYSTSAFVFAWTSARLARVLNLKYIPILHGGDLPKRIVTSPGRLSRLLKDAEKVVCPSQYLMDEMKRLVARDYEIIPNFIDLQEYPYSKKSIGKNDIIKLFWLRSFHKIYNPHLAVQILKALRDRGYNCQLCMVGPDKDGSMETVRKLAVKLEVSSCIKITGRLAKADWVLLSKEYNLFINTTDVDNTPVSVMEAMALGFPIVTTNAGGIPYLLENDKQGMVVLPGRVDLFLDAIEILIADKEKCVEMGASARRTAESWDWELVSKKWLALLR